MFSRGLGPCFRATHAAKELVKDAAVAAAASHSSKVEMREPSATHTSSPATATELIGPLPVVAIAVVLGP